MNQYFKDRLIEILPEIQKSSGFISYGFDKAYREDLVQMTVERALINHAKFEFGTSLKAWTTQIMRNIHLDIQKSHPVSRTTDLPGDSHDVFESDQQTLEAQTIDAEKKKAMDEFLRSQPEEQRTILSLWSEDYSYEQISEIIGISKENVGAILCRTRRSAVSHMKSRFPEWAGL